MSYPLTQLGGSGKSQSMTYDEFTLLKLPIAFNHSQSNNAEAEYDRLRGLARQEAAKRSSCLDRVSSTLDIYP